jgi:hypothetical protein
MTGIIFKLTTAGRAALVNAAHDGTNARRIASIGITATAFTPTDALASVPGEIKRITTIAGDVVAADTIHVTIRDDGADTYTVRGLGLYLDNGVLLGTYSQPAVILEKSTASIFLLATDVRVLDGSVDISTLQFGATDFINPPATAERQGVVQLATKAIAEALTDATRALTAASVAGLFAARALVDHIHGVATQAADGFMSKADKAKLDGIATNANKYELPSATTTALGGIKLGHANVQTVAAAAPTTTASRTYPVQANPSGQAVVNVPWVDTDTVYTLPAATATVLGGAKLGHATVQSVAANAVTAAASRSYAVQVNASGQMVVNVPWVDTDTVYTLPAATATVLGGVKLGHATVQSVAANAVTAAASRSYAVQVNASGQMVVNVPWVDTDTVYTLPAATATVLGGVKLGHATVQTVAAAAPTTTASRTYSVQVNASGQAVVNVPWVNTTYTLPTASETVLGGVKLATVQQSKEGALGNVVVTPAGLGAALDARMDMLDARLAAWEGASEMPWLKAMLKRKWLAVARLANVNYTNDTPCDIEIRLSSNTGSNSSKLLRISISADGGTTWADILCGSDNSSAYPHATGGLTVPTGCLYKFNEVNGANCWELRYVA